MNFRVLVTGSRNFTDRDLMFNELKKYTQETTIIHGGASGADSIAEEIAMSLGMDIIRVPAEWDKYGKAAGPIRNKKMLEFKPDVVIAFPVGKSLGTRDMMRKAEEAGVRVVVIDSGAAEADLSS